ncbi:AAA family ATPase [Anthocerotibacter panamensis]|uniref:AAA family ATPase n=1 Tax=Anthocerotibacter panamensis TaxID=2857077 RepID=UPI001C4057D5|nr:AAA family ATPase [Anthocerotibacter panamensis]
MTDCYIPERFRDRVALHIARNFARLPQVQVPLILGVHGPKGQGKTFMVEAILKHLGANPVHISAAELESPDAGEPSRLIRLRYREAAELLRVRGRVAVLVVHDLDAGAGRWTDLTQYTVNTQLVNATLMAIADNPHNVQLPGSYDLTPLPRIPILVTGNDFARLYAPLTRDGRMEKFFWSPTPLEKRAILERVFARDALDSYGLTRLMDTFPDQAIDFFAAIRAKAYDGHLLAQIKSWGLENLSLNLVNPAGDPIPFTPKPLTLESCLHWGEELAQEQQALNSGLVEEYLPHNKSSQTTRAPW